MRNKSLAFNRFITFVSIFFSVTASAQAPDFEWVRQMGSSGGSATGSGIVTDKAGNVLTVGTFSGTVDLDPGPGTLTLSSLGNNDVFISKIDSSGTLLWARRLGSRLADAACMTVDKYGNSFILCSYSDTIDADPGVGTFTLAAPAASSFILKLDPAGNFVWARSFNGNGIGSSISIDALQNIYTTGTIKYTVDFDPGPGTYNLTASAQYPQSQGPIQYANFYLSKLDSIGNFGFAKLMTNNSDSYGKAVINSSGEIITYGRLSWYTSPSYLFINKYSANGTALWAKTLSGDGNSVYSAATDAANNISLVGYFTGTKDFDPNVGVVTLSSPSATISSLYALQLDNSGNFNWVYKADSHWNTDDESNMGYPYYYHYDVTRMQHVTDASGSLYIAGSFQGVASFDPAGQTANLSSAAGSGFVMRIKSWGEFDWVKQVGENSTSTINAISLDNFGNLYTTGSFSGTVDFDPLPIAYNLSASGNQDAFVHKLSQPLVTGIKNTSLTNNVRLFPNPTASVVYVQTGNDLNNATCRVMNISGQVVQELTGISGHAFPLDVSTQAKGLYLLEIRDTKTLSRTRLVKD